MASNRALASTTVVLALLLATSLGSIPATGETRQASLPAVSQTIVPGQAAPIQGNYIPPSDLTPSPFSVVVDTIDGLIFAPTQGDSGLQRLVVANASYASWIESAGVPLNRTFPHQGAFDPINGLVYVADYGSGSISVFGGANGSLVKLVRLGAGQDFTWIYGVAFLQSTGLLYATVSGNLPGSETGVFVINATTDSVVARILVGLDPQGMAFDSSNGLLFVSNYGGLNVENGSVSVISTLNDSVIKTIQFPSEPYYTFVQNVFFASDGYVYAIAMNFWGGQHADWSLYKIDPADMSIVATIPMGAFDSNSGQMAEDPLGRLYITSGNYIQVLDVNTGRFIGDIAAGLETTGIAYDPFTADMLATNLVTGTISVIPTGAAPAQVTEATMAGSGFQASAHAATNSTGQTNPGEAGAQGVSSFTTAQAFALAVLVIIPVAGFILGKRLNIGTSS